MGDGIVKAPAMGVQRQEFGASSLAVSGATASDAAAAQAVAAVQARYTMAIRMPRDWDVVRQRLLGECRRKGFAEAALYRKPVGGSAIEGLSIRFAEAALRCMGNVYPETSIIWEDERKRIVRVSLTDLEANCTYTQDVVVAKTVERSRLRDGQEPIAQRTNSFGKVTYLVEASDDETMNKQAALVSKALRSHALRLLPGDIADEAEALIRSTLSSQAATDPGTERKRLADAFLLLGVPADSLVEYLGHSLAQVVPAELVELRAIHAALRDGEATWADLLEQKRGSKPAPKEEPKVAPAPAEAPKPSPVPKPKPSPAPQTVTAPSSGCPDCDAAREQMRLAASKSPQMLALVLAQSQRKHPAHGDLLAAMASEVAP